MPTNIMITDLAADLLAGCDNCPKCGADWLIYDGFLQLDKALRRKFGNSIKRNEVLYDKIQSCDLCSIRFKEGGN